ncbi:multisubunit sodium/proton antiporter, MrpC subunit [Gordonia malaquae]|uniref:Putative Na(+)/H(+) antiporter subunit C n=1 Tax=Gordonia malaquae NBRC 108250 TaxID=1223542 RepID=M3VG11_GORML|nr:Na(+)/H(+) antiporter subunit C [Gordonia malaquae]GAC80534.1 putative Na(+)/H(+) antiporter subunit C [Gordonia malaquae NBRC 108250]SEE18266.1 multisubunit sodium/proton antiporter, MrpC subunit [Gordonia malaquae]
MSVNLGLLVIAGVLAACGVYLLMERSLIRMLFGLMLVGNGINLLIVTLSGPPGNPPIRGRSSAGQTADADPLAQGMVLTAIVITMGVAAFVLALTYRLFVINRRGPETAAPDVEPTSTEGAVTVDDDVQDDPEDLKIATSTLQTFPDRDRSDDPLTGADTVAGDFFDDHGNPLTAEEFEKVHLGVIETDLMPEDADLLAHLTEDGDDMPEDSDDETTGGGDR